MNHCNKQTSRTNAYISIRSPERDLIASIVLIKPLLIVTDRQVLGVFKPDAEQKVLVSGQQLVHVQQQLQQLLAVLPEHNHTDMHHQFSAVNGEL